MQVPLTLNCAHQCIYTAIMNKIKRYRTTGASRMISTQQTHWCQYTGYKVGVVSNVIAQMPLYAWSTHILHKRQHTPEGPHSQRATIRKGPLKSWTNRGNHCYWYDWQSRLVGSRRWRVFQLAKNIAKFFRGLPVAKQKVTEMWHRKMSIW